MCFGVALLKAVGCKLLCGVILGLLCGIFRTGIPLLHPLLVACLLGSVLIGVEHGRKVVVHLTQQVIPLLERACGHGQLILLILCRRNFQIVTFQLIHLFAERIALLGLFLAVLFLLLFLLLCIGKLLLQLLDLLFLVIGQRIIICQRIQLAAGGIVLFIVQIALCLVQIGVELIVRLGSCVYRANPR